MPDRAISRRLFFRQMMASIAFTKVHAETPSAENKGILVLEAREGALRLVPDPAKETPIWGFNGAVPGPALRFKKGEEVKVRLVNKLEQPLTLSWHGVRIINSMDGVGGLTQKPVPPGDSFDYRFTPPDSGLYWYHSHVLPFVSEQLGRGLYGAMIVEEPQPPQADRELLVVLADWALDEDAKVEAGFNGAASAMGAGRIGSLVTVNSEPVPVTETLAPRARLRLRIVSAVNARVMFISFDGVRPWILSVDGQPCDDAFEPVRRTIPVGPGARFDMLFDLPETAGAEAKLILRGENEADRPLVIFKTEGEARDSLPPIASLPRNPLLPAAIKLQASRKIDIVIEGGAKPGETSKDSPPASDKAPPYWSLNGVAQMGFASNPLFSVKRGTPVTLGFINRTAYVQQMHVHGHHMRLLHDLDDGWEPYWRDCVLVPEGRTKHVAFIADNPGKWVIESLMLERAATGLATWFEVT
jgi:FtsP/CotA-like multicopper oxidase with cupredoxin domain